MDQDRRTVLAALGLAVPFGVWAQAGASPTPVNVPVEGPPVLRLRPFEDAVRTAFAAPGPPTLFESFPCRRVDVGHSDLLQCGVQGSHNDRPFAGFPAGHLRIVRVGFEPGPVVGGVRLYVAAIHVALTGGRDHEGPIRPLDFAELPHAVTLVACNPTPSFG